MPQTETSYRLHSRHGCGSSWIYITALQTAEQSDQQRYGHLESHAVHYGRRYHVIAGITAYRRQHDIHRPCTGGRYGCHPSEYAGQNRHKEQGHYFTHDICQQSQCSQFCRHLRPGRRAFKLGYQHRRQLIISKAAAHGKTVGQAALLDKPACGHCKKQRTGNCGQRQQQHLGAHAPQ